MSQVNLLSVDVGQSPDMKGSKGNSSIKNQAKGSAFSDEMAQHYPKKNQAESDGDINRNGKLVSKTAIEQAKKVKAEDAHILPVPIDRDDKLVKVTVDTIDDQHTLPVPVTPETEALNTKAETADDQHILPVPVAAKSEVLNVKADAVDDQHTLPVPVTPENEALIIKTDTIDDQHTLPVPVTPETEALYAKTAAIDDQHTLPVNAITETEAVNTKARVSDDQHTLPVPITPLAGENKAKSVTDKGAIDSASVAVYQQKQTIDGQVGNGATASTENDDTVNLLNMLNGAQKLLAKSNEAQASIEKESNSSLQQAQHALVNNKSEMHGKPLTTQQYQGSLAKNMVDDVMPANSKVDGVLSGDINESDNEPEITTPTQLTPQLLAQEADSASASKQNAIPESKDNKLESESLNKAQEVVAAQKSLSAALSAEEKAEVVEGEAISLQNVKQTNVVEFNSTTDKEPKRNINQKTIAVAATSPAESQLDTEQNKVMSDAKEATLSTEPDVELMGKAESEKQVLSADKVASSFNQTLDAHATRSTPSSGELSAQQEQSYQNTLDKLTSNTVQTQKSTTVLQTETIAIYRKDFADAVKDKVMVMINQKIQQVDIQLDPPEMGNIHVRVNLQNEQAAVQFIVQNQQAKDALEQNIGKLRDMLADNGVDVGDANIEQRQAQEQGGNAFNGQRANGSNGGVSDGTSNEVEHTVVNLTKASSTGVDYYA
ncbi:flagellar hook-length control protein FliK [Cognaticolwellia aestuarii]|uniref:flagellar hook-length control protein FliK n=1 Tax=Cognaticolwellia aestuarii TaxID=329993 RepID=UPI000984E961|nr:flagellar hook-length control protein FliK [Cognaticolwellia aestuarii]